MDLSAMTVGARIKFFREARHMTQKDLADRIGTTPQNIYKYEMDIITNIPITRIAQIASVLEIPAARIAGWDMETEVYYHPSIAKPATGAGDGQDAEMADLLERAKNDPHLRMLFSLAKDARPEDVEKTIQILQMFKGD